MVYRGKRAETRVPRSLNYERTCPPMCCLFLCRLSNLSYSVEGSVLSHVISRMSLLSVHLTAVRHTSSTVVKSRQTGESDKIAGPAHSLSTIIFPPRIILTLSLRLLSVALLLRSQGGAPTSSSGFCG